MTRIRVLSPVGVTSSDTLNVPPLPPSLAGRTVGFIDNRKANFDRLADEIGALLAVVPNCTFSRAVSRPVQPI